jgi:transcriptional regulator with XRE-family HTH domain
MREHVTVGELLRRKRTAAQLTQEAAASRSEVSARSWNRTENGAFNPSPSLLARMAGAVGASPEDLENVGADAAADVLRSLHDKPSANDDDLIRRLFAELTAAVPAGYSIRAWHGTHGEHGIEVAPLEGGAQQDHEADYNWQARRASGQ